jgi:hypothetical protein
LASEHVVDGDEDAVAHGDSGAPTVPLRPPPPAAAFSCVMVSATDMRNFDTAQGLVAQ